MKFTTLIGHTLRTLLWALLGICLFVAGALGLVYAPWMQSYIKDAVVTAINNRPGGMHISLDTLSIRPPLRLHVAGLCVTQDGDTMVRAGSLDARLALLPLLDGCVGLDNLSLDNAFYRMGVPDSALFLRIGLNHAEMAPARVRLKDMDIDVRKGAIRGGYVDLTITPDTAALDTTAKAQNTIRIALGHMHLDDFTYRMRMLPTIDSLAAHITAGTLDNGEIDLARQHVGIKRFAAQRLSAAYIAPDSATIAATPIVAPSAPSTPWIVQIDTIDISQSQALYTTRGVVPAPGFDPSYIQADSLSLKVVDFYNEASTLRLPLTLDGHERCGLDIHAEGTFALDSVAMYLRDMRITTPRSDIRADGMLGMGDMLTDPSLPLRLKARGLLSMADAATMFVGLNSLDIRPSQLPPLKFDADLYGSLAHLTINTMQASLGRNISFDVAGSVSNVLDMQHLGADIVLNGSIEESSLLASLLPRDMGIQVPPLALNGAIHMLNGTGNGHLTATTGEGSIALNGQLALAPQDYDLALTLNRFPVDAIMPTLGVRDVTASLSAKGHLFSPIAHGATLDAHADVTSLEYAGYTYHDISLDASVAQDNASIEATANCTELLASLSAQGNLNGPLFDWTANIKAERADLYGLKLVPHPTTLSMSADLGARINTLEHSLVAGLSLNNIDYNEDIGRFFIDNVRMRMYATDSVTNLSVRNNDLYAYFSSPSSLDSISTRFARAAEVLTRQVDERRISVTELQQALPPFDLDINAGSKNALTDILSKNKMGFEYLTLQATNDSILDLRGRMLEFSSGATRLDTISLGITQSGPRMQILGSIDNAPGTLDAWAKVRLEGDFDTNKLTLSLDQHDIQGRQGYRLGLSLTALDSTVTMHLTPYNPIIGYKDWSVNVDNYLTYNFAHKHLDANIRLHGDNSSLNLYTEHGTADGQEDLVVKLDDIHIADWISINPFAPPIKGDVSADMRINYTPGSLSGKGFAGIKNFYYGREKVADLGANFDLATATSGSIRLDADLLINGRSSMTLSGIINDTIPTSPLRLDLKVINLPLATVNPFLPSTLGRLAGNLNGTMDVAGDATHPRLNGFLQFDSTAVTVAMTATPYRFSDNKINVDNSVVRFNNFKIFGTNDNPLTINGTVDVSDVTSPALNLRLRAQEMGIVNTARAVKGADIYGKGFVDLNATVQGDMRLLNVKARAAILPGTNVTYIIPTATSIIENRANEGMVHFVNLRDTTQVQQADSITSSTMLMNIDAILAINNGSTINVDLSADGKNKVNIEAEGSLNYTQTPINAPRLTGRLNINDGYVSYSPPFLGEKLFKFESNSYVAFNGDMMDPVLNVHAVDRIKANVTADGQNSRLVNFDVLLGVTGTLAQMDAKFDLATNDDITIANQLQSMSPEQRANQAMNLLLYKTYTGPGTKGDANLSGNLLYSFLTSQINTWAANTIKGVDLSFGIDQYNSTIDGATAHTMTYSYQVSKSLFNDRFKIVVGGNYSTDANADENFSQNLINNISFEYYLNKNQTMLLRLFRTTGYESILEGEVTQTGVGFMYKRKMDSLRDIFRRARQSLMRRRPAPADSTSAPADTLPKGKFRPALTPDSTVNTHHDNEL